MLRELIVLILIFSAAAAFTAPPKMAVGNFSVTSDNIKLKYIGKGLAEMIAAEFFFGTLPSVRRHCRHGCIDSYFLQTGQYRNRRSGPAGYTRVNYINETYELLNESDLTMTGTNIPWGLDIDLNTSYRMRPSAAVPGYLYPDFLFLMNINRNGVFRKSRQDLNPRNAIFRRSYGLQVEVFFGFSD